MSGPYFVRRGLAAALVPLALTSLTACGGDNQTAADSSSSPTGSTSTSDGPGAPTAGATVGSADFVALFEAGFAALTTAHETMTFDLGSVGTMRGAGDVDYSGSSPAMTFNLSGGPYGGDGMEMRMVDGTMYVQIPGMSAGKFVEFDLSDPSNPLGSLGAQLDPREMFSSFEKGIDSVTFVGQEDVDGETLDHYSVAVDTAALLDSLDQSLPPVGASSGDKVTYEIWLDGDHRLHRMTVDMGATGTMEVTLSDWGKQVSVEAPSPDQVTEMPGTAG